MGMMDTSTKFEYRGIRKKIVIYSCKECPYISIKWSERVQDRKYNACAEKDYKIIRSLKIIPDWCPLDDER